MLEFVIFDADGVLFDSTESNTAYYNAIFARVGEPPMSPLEEKAGRLLHLPSRGRGDMVGADPARGAEEQKAVVRCLA